MNRKWLLVGGVLALLLVLPLVWYLASPLFIDDSVDEAFPFELTAAAVVMSDHMMDDAMPEAGDVWTAVASGTFTGADSFHQGSGTATIYQQGAQRVLRLEEFSVTNGPDLHIILSKEPMTDDYIDLGSLKGNLGNQNYDIPADVDLSQYPNVLIYCVPFHVVFATAVLPS